MKPIQFTFLNIAILVSILFIVAVISPFLTTLILAAILVTGAHPIHKWLLCAVGNRARLAAVLMSLFIGVVFSVLFVVFFIFLSEEAVSTYQELERFLQAGKDNFNELIEKASQYIGISPGEVITSITSAAQNLSGVLVEQSTNFIKSAAWLILNFFLLVFAMYFFFKDGQSIVKAIIEIIPLPKSNSREIFEKFRQVSLAMLYGIFLTAILQGILGGLGLYVAGIKNPIFWGTVMGFFGMLPVGGTGIIWLPAGLYLLATGDYIQGFGLLLWGGLIVGLIDNLVKPMIISHQVQIYPLPTFFVVIGGLIIFGLKGAIIAPMILAALVSLIHFYRLEENDRAQAP